MADSLRSADVVIVGGAAIGSSVACHLAMDPAFSGRVVVVEKDPSYRFCASALSAASIRQQFSSPVNIRMSRMGFAFLRELGDVLAVDGEKPTADLVEQGYLYLASASGTPTLRANHAVQIAEGADTVLMDRSQLLDRFPFIAADDIELASWGRSSEGWFDGWGLMQAFRRKARSLGVVYLTGTVTGIAREGGRVHRLRLANGTSIACGAIVNAAGASGGRQVAAMAGVSLPVAAKKRCVFSFACRASLAAMPLMIDVTGVWCRPEGHGGTGAQTFICGGPPRADDPDSDDFEVDWSLFEDIYWPALAGRVPAFEAIQPGRAWAGHYDMNLFDHNAIVGVAGDVLNFYLANGFSGHGLQQSPAIGRGLAELIVHGAYQTLDLSELGFDRIAAGRPVIERNVI